MIDEKLFGIFLGFLLCAYIFSLIKIGEVSNNSHKYLRLLKFFYWSYFLGVYFILAIMFLTYTGWIHW